MTSMIAMMFMIKSKMTKYNILYIIFNILMIFFKTEFYLLLD